MSINNLWKYILVARKHRTSDRISFGMRSKKSLYPEIEKTIRFLLDYETAKISYHEIKGSAELLNWIQSETTN